jgi:hypothetical protein
LSVDGSFVEANAAKESRIPRQQLAEAAQVNQTTLLTSFVEAPNAKEPIVRQVEIRQLPSRE